MNKDVERYLKQATTGLWGHKRKEIKEELAAHIQDKVLVHQLAGFSEAEASQRALQELGKPKAIRQGMFQLYSLPYLGFAGIFLAFLTWVLIPRFAALDPLMVRPSEACLALDLRVVGKYHNCLSFEPWLSEAFLREGLEPQGVTITKQEANFVSSYLTLNIPEPAQSLRLSMYSGLSSPEQNRPLPGYLELSNFIEQIAEQTSVQVTGLDNFSLLFNGVSLTFNASYSKQIAEDFYYHYSFHITNDFTRPPLKEGEDFSQGWLYSVTSLNDYQKYSKPQMFTVSAHEDGVYFLFTALDKKHKIILKDNNLANSEVYFADSLAESKKGKVSLRVPKTPWHLVTEFSNPPTGGETILLRFTGKISKANLNYGYELVLPDEVTLEPN